MYSVLQSRKNNFFNNINKNGITMESVIQEKGNLSIHTENIFPIIKKFLYSDHEIFLRELVSNAVDASQKIKSAVRQVACEISRVIHTRIRLDAERIGNELFGR